MKHILEYHGFSNEFKPNFEHLQGVLDLKDMLEENHIDTSEWGTHSSKTLYHLYLEVESGETVLKKIGPRLIREVSFIGGIIIHRKDKSSWEKLKEEKQVFVDGRMRERKELPYGLAEKFKSGENHKDVVIRGIKEELGVDIDENQIRYHNKRILHEKDSGDYPTLMSKHTGYEYLIEFNDDQYNADGYIEKQVDKSVYFVWTKLF